MRCLLLILITGNLSAQSAWIQPKGNTYLQLSFSAIANYNALFLDRKNTNISYFIQGYYKLKK